MKFLNNNNISTFQVCRKSFKTSGFARKHILKIHGIDLPRYSSTYNCLADNYIERIDEIGQKKHIS